MKTRRLRFQSALIALSLGALALSSCGPDSTKEKPLTIYLWSNALYQSCAPNLQKQFPDIEMQFVVGQNDLDFYAFMNKHGKLPDIITCRRFALHDAAPLKDNLMDLSVTEAAGQIYDRYLQNFTNAEGQIQWLPMCGEVDGYIANRALFEKHNIPLPTDYESFVSACDKFAEVGIRGFAADFAYDYTCMEILQGLSIPELMSIDGRSWRSKYESPTDAAPGLDSKVWPKAFQTMSKFLDDAKVDPTDVNLSYSKNTGAFLASECAMIRAGGGHLVAFSNYDKSWMDPVFLPYFGQNGEEWLLTYPAFQIALNKSLSENSARRDNALRVLDYILSEEGQNGLAGGADIITYNKNVNLELSDALSNLKELIDANRLYIRIASNDFFRVSKEIVQKMIKREIGPTEAYALFDQSLRTSLQNESDVALTIEEDYDCVFDAAKGGNPSFSAMANTLRGKYETDVLLAQGYSFTGTTFAGEYNPTQVSNMIMPNALDAYRVELTGAQLLDHVALFVEGCGKDFTPFNKGSLPIFSGLEAKVAKVNDGFEFVSATIGGNAINPEKTYSAMFVSNANDMGPILQQEGITFTKEGKRVRDYLKAEAEAGSLTISAPTAYIAVVSSETNAKAR
ncbi:MAG: carbohydrate ABC transporter substrate-binding protein [Candidatus Enteromonas sp.]